MKALPVSLLALLLAAATLLPGMASARSSDRNKPMDIEAGYSDYSMDDSRPTVLTGGPVRLNQQLDDGKPMDAVATKVDYDLRNEVVVFTGDVNISQPSGSISGQRIVYNMRTGQVQGGGEGAGRVKMRIMPRNGGASADPEPASDGDEG